MLKHNLLLYLRNIKKHKSSFLINLVGLSTGLICVLLVYLWVFDEINKDKFHQNDERLYQVRRNVPMGLGAIGTFTSNSSLMLTALQQEIPEVEMATAVYTIDNKSTLQTEEKKLSGFGWMASEDFFKVFSFPLISGDKNTVLADANTVTISSELSTNFFGEGTDPIGKTIAIKVSEENVDDIFTITGVFEVPKDSSEEFDFILPYKTFLKYRDPNDIAWYSNSSSMYVLLKPDIDIKALNTKMADFLGTKSQYSKNEKVLFTKYSDNYLRGTYENGKQAGGRITYVILFSIVALFVLSIACINFMNLSTARASRRLKEVGVKKAVGANRRSLIFQFLSESLFLSFLALVCAYIVVIIILPWFNDITGKELVFSVEPEIIITLIAITLLTGLTSGSYPAFYLTKFNAVKVLKGKISTSFGELMIRKGLVVFQFSISILLIVAVSVIYMQLDFIQSKNLGYNKDNVMVIDRQDGLITNMEVFLEEAKQIQGVVNASFMQGGMTNFSNSSRGHSWPGQTEEGKEITFRHSHVGPEFIETMGIEMKLGRSYIDEKPDNDSKIILNETAVKMMGLENPIGTIVNMRGPNREIIGVVKDFNIQSLYDEIAPMALLCRTEWVSSLVVRIKAGEEKATISELTNLYNKFNPGLGFNFRFLDDQYQQLYQSEQRVATLSKYFAGMAILISCLGLFGLAAFTAERRRKEISIRKVLGQSISQVTVMLSSEFVKLVMVAIVISLPIAYLLAVDWLSEFAYRISLHSGYFIGAGLAALIVAMLTVGSQAMRAANENPIKALREE